MDTRYNVINSRCSNHFWLKCMFSQLLSTIKVKIVDKMMQNSYLCVILYVRHKKNAISRGYNLIFNSFVKSDMVAKMAPLLVTSQASSSAATDKIYLILLRRSKAAVHLRQNRFEILQHIKNSREGSHQPPPPPLNVLRWGCEFACMSEGWQI